MQIQKNNRNEHFKRNEVNLIIEADKNPSFIEAKKMISEELKKPEENIDVFNIYGKFGLGTFLIKSFVYDTKKDLDKALLLKKTKKQRDAENKAVIEAKKKAEEEAKAAKESAEPSA